MKFTVKLLFILAILGYVNGDVYLHNMRGSNNRLNENTATRTNANRLFDSQNNNRGGYNVGDKSSAAFNTATPTAGVVSTYDYNTNQNIQYPLVYYEGSILPIEWTNQHGCGGRDAADPHTVNCNIVIQYTCDTGSNAAESDDILEVDLRDGGNTATPDKPNTYAEIAGTKANNIANNRGHQESEAFYYSCSIRDRNKGLFTATQNLKGDQAIYTRQNPNGDRYGLECPEERDYYPYWHPSPWIDVAYLANNVNDENINICDTVNKGSQNNNNVYGCFPLSNTNAAKTITEAECIAAGGTWKAFNKNIAAPQCLESQWSRDNHLGNGRNGLANNYTWSLPAVQTLLDRGFKNYGTAGNEMVKCALRLRYNISTDDYDPWNTFSNKNQKNTGVQATTVVSPVQNNPTVFIGADTQGLQLALNTAQTGRTFQDRSHVFYIKKRPAKFANKNIYNLNVRGKRGNIVQVYPAVEYDFIPNDLRVKTEDLIHIQWTGSNTHNNGGNGGDGQAGDDGQGTGGTDRSNFVLSLNEGDNYPLPLDKFPDNMFTHTKCYRTDDAASELPNDGVTCPLILATSGYFQTKAAAEANANDFNALLNNAPASLVGGIVMSISKPGFYPYFSSRNNNFSNRSQKGKIFVSPTP